jgi:MFS family permease
VPARNALLADVVPAEMYGRAYGFERAMDNLGAIGGPLLALVLVAAVGVRGAILLSVIPGLLAAGAVIFAIRATPHPTVRERQPLRIRVRPVMNGPLGRMIAAVSAFEAGNCAATLLLLRATQLFTPGRGHNSAAEIALVLYIGYNLAATLISVPAGRSGDRRGNQATLVVGTVMFLVAYVGFAVTGASLAVLALSFVAAGVAIGCVETAENAAVATLAAEDLRGSAFGLLAAVQSVGNLAASAIAGVLWTLVSPRAAFIYLAACMAVALIAFSAVHPEPAGQTAAAPS